MGLTGKSFIMTILVGLCYVFVGCPIALASPPPGVVVDYYSPESEMYVSSPSIAILPDGDYVAAHDQHPGMLSTFIFRSEDKGSSWSWVTQLPGQYESTLFVLNGELYLLGGYNNGVEEFVTIRKSTDGGSTWTEATSGYLTEAGGYNGAPTPVLIHNGRIWRAIEKVDSSVPPGLSQEFRAMVISAPVQADLLNVSNWTISNTLLMKDYIPNKGWLEGNVAAAPNGAVKNILRVAGMTDKAAVIEVSSDGALLSFNTQSIIDFPGGASKFTIRYDPQSDLYWSLVNEQLNPPSVRNRLKLSASADLVNWTVIATILEDNDSTAIGFQYADWQFEGSDIIFVSRTAFGGSGNFHDAEFMTFHRIANFRMLTQGTTSILTTVEDAEIDGHINWRSDPKGIPQPQWSHDATELRVRIYDPVTQPGAEASHALLKWDVSGIPTTDVVTGVTLEMSGWDGFDAPIDVYGISQGQWSESTVTWNNWAATPQSLTWLGQLSSAGPAETEGQTVFTSSALTEWVQNWVNGNSSNNGLILKMSGSTPVGDSFSSREEPAYGYPPRLLVQHFPASAFVTVQGTIVPYGYAGDLRNMGIQVELRQNDVVTRTERMLLDAGGNFAVNTVPDGTYDVAVKAFAYLQQVVMDVSATTDPTDLGIIVLDAGDLNGDSEVNLLDFALMANNWLSIEDQ